MSFFSSKSCSHFPCYSEWKTLCFLWAHKLLWPAPMTMLTLSFSVPAVCTLCLALYVHTELLQSCPTLCDPMDYSPQGSSVHGILQTRILEWFAMPLSRGSSWPRDWTHVSCIADWLFALWATKHNVECMQIFQAGVGEGVLWFSRETGLKGLCVYKCQLSTLNMI